MTLSLRQRIWLTLAPLLVLIGVLGAAGLVLLNRLGNAGSAILRENYDSVVAMVGLNEALERIDSSFQFALAGRTDARDDFDANWPAFDDNLAVENRNITLPGEAELAAELSRLRDLYRAEGEAFYRAAPNDRHALYFGKAGLLARFHEIKTVSGDIRAMNQRNMEEASQAAKDTARASRVWFAGGLLVAGLAAALAAGWMARTILRPIRAVTRSATAIGAGNLNQQVPVVSHDELGQLAEAFNGMAGRLRDYRESHSARLVRARQTSQAAIDAFPDPVVAVDPEGRVEMANPAARLILGVVSGEGQLPPWQPPDALRGPLADALQRQQPFVTQAFDQTIGFRLEGEERSFLPQVLPIRDPYGGTLGAVVVLNDVTRFRLLDRVKSDLVATVSHELKTPLTSVRLAVHLLLEEAVGPLTPKQTELLLDARENAERLLNRIEHLLALARLERPEGALDLRPEDPADLLRRAADSARPRAEDKHVELAVEPGEGLPSVAADAVRLDHALTNLVDNALTYTTTGGRVTLSASAEGEGRVHLTVADTGIGIPPEYLPHVFDKFFRVPGRGDGRGTGLGLAIVKEIVTAHRGEITCESRPGEGTVFTITLPVWGTPTNGGPGHGDRG
jgi:signal transduction histidine kinase